MLGGDEGEEEENTNNFIFCVFIIHVTDVDIASVGPICQVGVDGDLQQGWVSSRFLCLSGGTG